MSGGTLTDGTTSLYAMMRWAEAIEKDNPLLATQLRDLYSLLRSYDYYLSGDIGENAINEAWKQYCEKWIEMDSEHVEELLFDRCLYLVHSAIKGYRVNEDE